MTTIHQYRQQKRKHDEKESATPSQEERSHTQNSQIRFTKKLAQFVSFLNRPCILYKTQLEPYQISMMEFFSKSGFFAKKISDI